MRQQTIKLIGGYVGGAIACAAAVFGKRVGFEIEPEFQIGLFVVGLGMFGVSTHGALYTTPPKDPPQ